MNFPQIDVIIPCYNAEATLERAVRSVIEQPELGTLWLIDDGSCDKTFLKMGALFAQFPDKIRIEQLPENGGAAKARNWGLLQSQAEFVAFLDADDAYQPLVLQAVSTVFACRPELSVLRLPLQPVDLPVRYLDHPDFARAWQYVQMTVVSNTAYRRAFLLACGGFPQEDLFRQFGGEDGALGIATTQIGAVGTLFEEPNDGQTSVLHYCRADIHAARLLDAILFQQVDERIGQTQIAQAEAVSARIVAQMNALKQGLNAAQLGVQPLRLERNQ